MVCWYCPAGVQGMAGYGPRNCGWLERLTLSAPLDPWVLTERASSIGRSQSAPTASVGEESRAEVWRIPGRKRRSESDYVPSLARPFGRGLDSSPSLPLGIWAGPGGARCRYAICWAEHLLWSGPIGDPGFMNPTLLNYRNRRNREWDARKRI